MIAQPIASPSSSVGLSWYVDRQPSPKSFASWAEQSHPTTRLRSIVGPPGSGKTTFLWALARILWEQHQARVQINLTPELVGQPTAWLIEALKDLQKAGHISLSREPEHLAHEEFHRIWLVLIRALRHQPAVLLIDGFDEIDPDSRQWVEDQLLVPFLFRPGEHSETRAVIARRDEFALVAPSLRWEDEVHPLQGLLDEQKTKQVRERLTAVQQAQTLANACAILEWSTVPTAPIERAMSLNNQECISLVDTLKPFLTPNPFVNLLLLQQQLLHPDEPLDNADHRACLEAYLQRANLKDTSMSELIDLINRQTDPSSFRLTDLSERQGHFEVKQRVKGLIDAGMVSQIPGTARYRFDPAIIQLVKQTKDTSGVAA